MTRRGWACRACMKGDCADCSNWLDRSGLCTHACADDPRQLQLPWVTGEGSPAAAGQPETTGRRRHAELPQDQEA